MKKYFLLCLILLINLSSSFAQLWTGQAKITDGYTDKLSYRPGEAVTYYLQGSLNSPWYLPASACEWKNALYYWSYDPTNQSYPYNVTTAAVFDLTNSGIYPQGIPHSNPYENGYGFSSTYSWTIPSNTATGVYWLDQSTDGIYPIPLIIKGDNTSADVVVVCPTNTMMAYNFYGGKSLYPYNSTNACESQKVSFYRPLPNFGEGLNLGLINWLRSQNYSLNVISDVDLDNDYNEIANAKLVIISGHSEYWTRQARENIDRFVDAGKNLLNLSGNTMWWQVRYENSGNNPQMVCYREPINPNKNPCGHVNDPECDKLLVTNRWFQPSQKYSILGSIGAESRFGGFGIEGSSQYKDTNGNYLCDYKGFGGFKVLKPTSPIFNGLGFYKGYTIKIANGEIDGTLISNIDPNNHYSLTPFGVDPVLDVNALGFYKAEMIAYDQTNVPDYPKLQQSDDAMRYLGDYSYCPIMVFQKTYTSGKVINTNTNEWCDNLGIEGGTFTSPNCSSSFDITPTQGEIPQITKNMIDLLLQDTPNNSVVWADPTPPTAFTITPAPTTVSYSACVTDGLIDIKPGGVYLTNGFKVDNNDGTFSARIESCVTCNHSTARTTGTTSNNGKDGINNTTHPHPLLNGEMKLFPNPFSTTSTLQINLATASNLQVVLYNTLGQQVQEILPMQSVNAGSHQYQINRNNLSAGIYLLEIKTDNETVHKQVVIQ